MVLAAAAMGLSGRAQADDSGLYLGVQLYGAFHSSSGSGDTSGGATIGYRFNEYLGVEASYKKTHLDAYAGSNRAGDIHGTELAVRGTLPLTDWLGLTAKAGAYHWQAGEWSPPSAHKGTDPVVGAGLLFHVSEHVSLSTEFEHIMNFGANAEENRRSIGVRVDF
jgi:hypothetical protein